MKKNEATQDSHKVGHSKHDKLIFYTNILVVIVRSVGTISVGYLQLDNDIRKLRDYRNYTLYLHIPHTLNHKNKIKSYMNYFPKT